MSDDHTTQGNIVIVGGGHAAAQLCAGLATAGHGARVHLVCDFKDVNYTSSAGLRSLLGALKESRRLGGDLRMAAVQPSVLRVLSLSGFASIIKPLVGAGPDEMLVCGMALGHADESALVNTYNTPRVPAESFTRWVD